MDDKQNLLPYLILLGIVYLLLLFSISLLWPPYHIMSKDLIVNYLNLRNQVELSFYKGVVDAYANLIAGNRVCRSINIYRMLKDVIRYNYSKEFYLILDKNHIRGYFNGTIYDFTAPLYKFHPSNTTIIQCRLVNQSPNSPVLTPICTVVYDSGDIVPGVNLTPILAKIFNGTR